jgi:hypothetical protein
VKGDPLPLGPFANEVSPKILGNWDRDVDSEQEDSSSCRRLRPLFPARPSPRVGRRRGEEGAEAAEAIWESSCWKSRFLSGFYGVFGETSFAKRPDDRGNSPPPSPPPSCHPSLPPRPQASLAKGATGQFRG